MIRFPNAKINIGLQILSRRADNYHNLSTLFYPIGWSDALEVVPASGSNDCNLHISGIAIIGDMKRNLVVRAYHLLADDYDLPSVDVYLHKNIPFGAGLGGGSADAATMLIMLRDLFHLPLSDADLADYAVRLGADCPFFIYNRPMLAEGIGNIFTSVEFSLCGYSIMLVKPDVSVSTSDAYAMVSPMEPSLSLTDIIALPVEEWRDNLVNDFEKSVFPQYPILAQMKQRLYDIGAIYASMSGSGSTLYGIFQTLPSDISSFFPNCRIWSAPCGF